MAIKITTPTNGGDSINFGSGVTAIAAEVTGSEVSSGEGKLEFKTTTGGTSATKVTVLANGDVGIGISNPSNKLHVHGAGSTYARIKSTNAGSGAGLYFQNATSSYLIGAGPVTGASELAFYDVTNSVERMRITSDGDLKFNSGYGSAATAYGCRAWVNFNGTGTVAIRASGNVSSITDNGTGSYDVNFTVAMVDANYVCNVNASTATDAGNLNPPAGMDRTTAKVRIDVEASGGSQYNAAQIDVTIVR